MKYIVTLNGNRYEVEVEAVEEEIKAEKKGSAVESVSADGEKVVSPMPGTILSVNVSEGDTVKTGDVLFILEAMKMENEIISPVNGTVSQILVSKGGTVETDAVLAVIS
ncbi:MAG: biotin/lipoyl-binding protein [Clostridia bacterium]|nr:biotin/lipoyl-binding protein [Clostridia bacterium]